MSFVVAMLIIAGACSLITARTLIGYSNLGILGKILITLMIIAAWLAPLLVNWIRKNDYLQGDAFKYVSGIGYFLFGLAFILFALLVVRDFIWYLLYGIAKLSGNPGWAFNPMNITSLNYANAGVVVLALGISFYALYEGVKIPSVKEVEFASAKIKNNLSFVHLTDIHINRASSPEHLQAIVEKTNALQPDFIVMTGDIVDDNARYLDKYFEILSELKASYGVYYSVGNHEGYSGMLPILEKLRHAGFEVLFNRGHEIPELNVFIAGIPDLQLAGDAPLFKVDFEQALHGTEPNNYRILLSHRPNVSDFIDASAIDLQLSGHTHGGQIFPFHLLAKKANRYLSGTYFDNGVDIYVSNGAGYWGPPMRLLAPSEITHITVKAFAPAKAETKPVVDKDIQELINAQNLGLGL